MANFSTAWSAVTTQLGISPVLTSIQDAPPTDLPPKAEPEPKSVSIMDAFEGLEDAACHEEGSTASLLAVAEPAIPPANPQPQVMVVAEQPQLSDDLIPREFRPIADIAGGPSSVRPYDSIQWGPYRINRGDFIKFETFPFSSPLDPNYSLPLPGQTLMTNVGPMIMVAHNETMDGGINYVMRWSQNPAFTFCVSPYGEVRFIVGPVLAS